MCGHDCYQATAAIDRAEARTAVNEVNRPTLLTKTKECDLTPCTFSCINLVLLYSLVHSSTQFVPIRIAWLVWLRFRP